VKPNKRLGPTARCRAVAASGAATGGGPALTLGRNTRAKRGQAQLSSDFSAVTTWLSTAKPRIFGTTRLQANHRSIRGRFLSVFPLARDLLGAYGLLSFLQNVVFIQDAIETFTPYLKQLPSLILFALELISRGVAVYRNLIYPLFELFPFPIPHAAIDVICSLFLANTITRLITRHVRKRFLRELGAALVSRRLATRSELAKTKRLFWRAAYAHIRGGRAKLQFERSAKQFGDSRRKFLPQNRDAAWKAYAPLAIDMATMAITQIEVYIRLLEFFLVIIILDEYYRIYLIV